MQKINDAHLLGSAKKNLNTFTYDANGNILTQTKHDMAGTQFENLSYQYHTINLGLQQNRLYHVNDAISSTQATHDIDDQGTFTNTTASINTNNNYRYDEIGNLQHDEQEEIEKIEWTVSGKMAALYRKTGSTKPNLTFDYDAAGNRIAKHVLDNNNNLQTTTYYVRDATGNIISTYQLYITSSAGTYHLTERPLYGSARLGINTTKINLNAGLPSAPYDSTTAETTLGQKQYEISNHLGNVLSVITDKKLYNTAGSYFEPEIVAATDYYAFGSPMIGRDFSSGNYRFGYGGHEKDDEVSGIGNHLAFGDYGLDTRLGRRWNVDPKTANAPYEGTYTVLGCNPMFYIDPDGNFKLNYTEKQLNDNGLTKLDVVRFESIVNNIYNLVKDNNKALEAIANTTGFSLNTIEEDFKPNNGPDINIAKIGGGAKGQLTSIVFDPTMIKSLANIDGTNKAELSEQSLGMALVILHEYGHHGDQKSNKGHSTGQYSLNQRQNSAGGITTERIYDKGTAVLEKGKQRWKSSLTGERGLDVTIAGFGLGTAIIGNTGKIEITKGKLSITTGGKGAPSVPTDLPTNAKETKVLETLKVE
jgi:hypothetical protein